MFEESITLQSIPLSVWMPECEPSGVVLLGHGLGVDRFHRSNQFAATLLTDTHGLSAIAPEIPLHGERSDPTQSDIVSAWQGYWSTGGWQQLVDEWQSFYDYAAGRFPGKPIGYFGISLGTQYGIPFIAHQPEIRAAVLGLFGSLPEPKTPLMNHFAPGVTCPVFFVQQLADEIHPLATTHHLYDSLGSEQKVLEANPGLHAEISQATFERAARFLAEHLM